MLHHTTGDHKIDRCIAKSDSAKVALAEVYRSFSNSFPEIHKIDANGEPDRRRHSPQCFRAPAASDIQEYCFRPDRILNRSFKDTVRVRVLTIKPVLQPI